MTTNKSEIEAQSLLNYYGDFQKCFDHLTSTFAVIAQRTQMMLSLSTIALTITGFSGPKIASSNTISCYSMILGLILVLSSMLINVWGVLCIHWTSHFIQKNHIQTLQSIIEYRHLKTSYFVKGSICLVLGLSAYVVSVITFLIYGINL